MNNLSSPVEVIINVASGAGDKHQARSVLTDIFNQSGKVAHISMARNGAEAVEIALRAAQGNAKTIVAGGGDGTIAAVASTLLGTNKTFGVLPLGTFNYFARNLGVPLDIEGAARNIIEGRVTNVSVGEVNGRIFLNNASLGLYPAVLRRREKVYKQWGRSRLAAYFSVALVILRPSSFLKIKLISGGQQMLHRTPLIFVGNNKYQLDEFNMRGRSCVGTGEMAFYITHPIGRIGLFRLAIRGLFKQLLDADEYQVLCLKEASIEMRRKKMRVAMDGEIIKLNTPLHFRLHTDALRVIVPQS